MAEKSRSLSVFLFICALLSGVIFYGCGGGGGTSSDRVPLQISGNVTSIIPLAALRADSALNPELRSASSLAGIEVYLENYHEQNSTTSDEAGNFLLSNVPAGSHYLVAQVETATGTTLKVRSKAPVSVTESRPSVEAPSMVLVTATASASGRIVDVSGNPVINGRLTVWGEPFYTDNTGYFSTPPMPENVIASIVVAVPGYRATEVALKFTDNPPFVEQTIVNNSSANMPPTSTLSASRYTVSPGVSISLAATASDPDEELDSDNYSWTATIGTFSGSINSLAASWIAPSENAVATITFIVTDNGGLKSQASVQIIVGTGIYAPNIAPTISDITSELSEPIFHGSAGRLSVVATDSNGDEIIYTWSGEGSFTNLHASSTYWTTPTVTATKTVTVTVVADDQNGGLATSTRDFVINYIENDPPDTPVITSPVANGLYLPGQLVNFKGSATDPQDGAIPGSAMTWLRNGTQFATGSDNFSDNLPTTPATYTITLSAADEYGVSTSKTISIRVNSPPSTPSISEPTNNYSAQIGTLITFKGSASDVEDGAITGSSLTWVFPDPIGVQTGSIIATNTLPAGNHVIQLTARDSMGEISDTATVQVTITNTGPTMTIDKPVSGTSVIVSTPTSIEGHGVSVDSQPVEASTMVWEVWREGVATETIASETSGFSYTFDNLGAHVLTLTGKDSTGEARSTNSTFFVNATPSVQIDDPASGTRFDWHEEIHLAATLSDPYQAETASLTASWTSSIDDYIGSGETLSTTALSHGSHVITCTAVDPFGLASSTQIMLLVNTLPVATITPVTTNQYATAPGDIPVFLSTNAATNITFDIDAEDAEDGALSGDSIRWSYIENNIETPFATGVSVARDFAVGFNKVRARIYDSYSDNFEDQASATYDIEFYVWQSRLMNLTETDLFFMHGDLADLHLVASQTLYEYKVNLGVNPYLSLTASESLAKFAVASCAVPYTVSDYMVLGLSGVNPAISTDTASTTFDLGSDKLLNAFGIAYSGESTLGYVAAMNRLVMFNPANGQWEQDLSTAAGEVFTGLSRIRVLSGGTVAGKVFAVDTDKDRIVRYPTISLGSPVSSPATAPVDVAVAGELTSNKDAYLMSLSNPLDLGLAAEDRGVVSVYYVSASESTFRMKFGTGTSTNDGKLITPMAMHFDKGDLYFLEQYEAGKYRIQMIRSGMTKLLQD